MPGGTRTMKEECTVLTALRLLTVLAVVASMAAPAPAQVVLWTNSPYVATGPSSLPPPGTVGPSTLRIDAAVNEYEHAILNITNRTDRPMELQIHGQLPGQVGRPRSSMNASVQKIAQREKNLLKTKLSALPEKSDGLAMPLVELNELQTVFVQPHSTRQLWFTVQTRDLRPGTTRHTIRLEFLSHKLSPIDVPVELTVWDIRLEDEAPIGVFCFDYAGDYQWMSSYKINTWFRGAFPPSSKGNLELDANGELKDYKTDIDRVKRRLNEGAQKFLFSYGYTGSFNQWAKKNGIAYMSDRWQKLFKQILARMVREWLDAGLEYDDFALQTIDEAHDAGVQQVVETTPLIREVDPKVRTAMTIMTDLDQVKQMAPHVDVWITRNGAYWSEEQEAFFGSEQAKGKPVWSWNMPSTPKSKPLTDFRTYGWRAMKFDFDAIGFFLYFGLVYDPMRPNGGIATRHWEAWRDGIEDYQLLWTLREAIRAARERGEPGTENAERVLHSAVDGVITEKFFPANVQETDDAIQAARLSVAAAIKSLKEAER